MNCIVCKNSNNNLIYKNLKDRLHQDIEGKYNLKRCNVCGLIFLDPQPTTKEITRHYPSEYGVYNSSSESRKKFLVAKWINNVFLKKENSNIFLKAGLIFFYYKLAHLPDFIKSGRVLDVGCSLGDRLLMLIYLGWQVEGVEISKKAAVIARCRLKKSIYNSTFEKAKLPNNYYDAVYLNNVFEHFKKPMFCLKKIRHILKKGGQLIVVVPNSSSLSFRIFKQNTLLIDVPRHYYTYNENNLTRILKEEGFIVNTVVYSNCFSSFSSGFALLLGKKVDYFKLLDKMLWLMGFVLDPILNVFGVGDYLIIKAEKVNK